ncbi:hypothetical protein DC347_20135 [Pseudarthrobacter sp. AG30]|nr:hypothetical protein DC347_20135 [Pseudarthrobacter sp. AG30]
MRDDKAPPKLRLDTERQHPMPSPASRYSGSSSIEGQDPGDFPLFFDPVAQLLQGMVADVDDPLRRVLPQRPAATSSSQRKRPSHHLMTRNARISAVVTDLRNLQTTQQDDGSEQARKVH